MARRDDPSGNIIDNLMYWTVFGLFWLIGKVLRFIFDVIVFLVMRKWHQRKQDQGSYSFPLETRFEHMHIVAGSGHGKTQMLQRLIYEDL